MHRLNFCAEDLTIFHIILPTPPVMKKLLVVTILLSQLDLLDQHLQDKNYLAHRLTAPLTHHGMIPWLHHRTLETSAPPHLRGETIHPAQRAHQMDHGTPPLRALPVPTVDRLMLEVLDRPTHDVKVRGTKIQLKILAKLYTQSFGCAGLLTRSTLTT